MLCLQPDIKITLNLMMLGWEINNQEIIQFKEFDIIFKLITS